jgi:hypothetical protein
MQKESKVQFCSLRAVQNMPAPEVDVDREIDSLWLDKFLRAGLFDKREALILKSRFCEGKNLEQTGNDLARSGITPISRERVRQLQNISVSRLKSLLETAREHPDSSLSEVVALEKEIRRQRHREMERQNELERQQRRIDHPGIYLPRHLNRSLWKFLIVRFDEPIEKLSDYH